MSTSRCWIGIGMALGLALGTSAPGLAAGDEGDGFLRGYVTAVLDRASSGAVLVRVAGGDVYLDERTPRAERARLERRLRDVPGVARVLWVRPGSGEPGVAAGRGGAGGFALLPGRSLFEPLSADPRWPRFSAAGQEYRSDAELDRVGAVSLGGTLPILQSDLPGEGSWELAIQGSVFSIFDLDASSLDLVNSDFFAALPLFARWSGFSLMLRPYHQSSHLGDEFLLRDRVERIDVSFEGVDALASLDVLGFARLYAGGGILVHREPEDLERRSVQAGIELRSPVAFFGGRVRPIAAFDASRREENDWDTDYSARAGLQFENAGLLGGRRLQLMAEYYRGFSPNGQFFNRRIEYFGVGLHFHL